MINPKEFNAKDSRWQDIFLFLKNKGFDVYSPGEKVGECKKPYVVITHAGGSKLPSFSTDEYIYTVMCYVPRNNYSKLEPFVLSVKEIMKELRPMILDRGQQTPSYYDDSLKAHMISIDYINYKKR